MDLFLRKRRANQDHEREEEARGATPKVARNKAERLRLIRASAERHSDLFAEVAERNRLRRQEEAFDPGSSGDDGPRVDPVREYIRADERGRNELGER